jgi:hypothetical protein
MALNLSPIGGAAWQFFSNDGVPLAGGLLYTYEAGTSTALSTYATSLGNIPNTNPVVMDSAGRPPQEIWLSPQSYKFVLKDSAGNLIGTWDNISGIPSGNQAQYQTATQGQTVFNVGFTYIAGTNTLNVSVNGSKQVVGLNYTETNATTVTFASGLNVDDIVEFYIS